MPVPAHYTRSFVLVLITLTIFGYFVCFVYFPGYFPSTGLKDEKCTLSINYLHQLATNNDRNPNRVQTDSLNEENESCVDLVRFVMLIANWPKDKPKAAIYFLVQAHPDRLKRFVRILRQLKEHVIKKHQYPVIIFHEKDFNGTIRDNLRKEYIDIDMYFQEIQFQFPQYLKQVVPEMTPCSYHGIGYRHMCRFHSKLVYRQPIILKALQYLWRLDDDSEIRRPVLLDPFKYMQDNNMLYGFYAMSKEADKCLLYLRENVTRFLQQYNISETEGWKDNSIYYNNFEISNTNLWNSQHYQNYIEFLDRSGGIYFYRWGDAPIKTIFIKLFLKPENIHQFSEIKYAHQFIGH